MRRRIQAWPIAVMLLTSATAFADGDSDGDAEQTAYQAAKPVFEKYCVGCHSTSGAHASPKAMEHLDMSAYPFGGHHAKTAGAEVREALGASGKPATMPDNDPGAVKGDDLALVLAWADAFDKAHPGAATQQDDDDDSMKGMDMHG